MKKFIENNFGLFVILALVVAFAFPSSTKYFTLFPEYALMAVLFLAFLKTDFLHFFDLLKKPIPILFYTVVNLFLLPVLVFWGFNFFGFSSAALAFMLISATPAAAATVVLSDLCKGDPNYSLLTIVISSVICPISIPFLINILIVESVEISFLDMFLKLFMMIIVPLVVAVPFRLFFKRVINKTKSYFSVVSIFLLIIVVLGSVDGLQEKVFSSPSKLPLFISITVIFFVVKYGISLLLGFWMVPAVRVSYSIASAFINIGLILVFTKNFFSEVMDGEVLLFMVLVQGIWNLGLFPLQKISHWIIKRQGSTTTDAND